MQAFWTTKRPDHKIQEVSHLIDLVVINETFFREIVKEEGNLFFKNRIRLRLFLKIASGSVKKTASLQI